ncbi:response regulator [Ideonella sp. DXS22W]|uniref:Response regulator n=1 Tax=Pseudaquabacterium inlustre TaxID=2984192 RepID=A0ABU9CJT1_9BURK
MSKPLDTDIDQALALVVDANPSSRRTLVNMLREFGVKRIEQAVRPQDARGMLEIRPFDIVLCDYHFPGEGMSGQELMDDLRQSGILPLHTVVVMISGEADYGHVAEAAEVALDAYLLKPHTAEALRVRLTQARERKRALADVFALIADKQFQQAAELAQARADERGIAWLQAARIAADLWLRLGRPADSARLLEAVVANGALPWARLGLARAQTEAGSVFQARRTLEGLIGDQPGYTDAYDVMGRVQFEQGDTAAAIATLRQASKLTPNSVARLVKLGLLQFYFGDVKEAAIALMQAVKLGIASKVFDLQGLTLLATIQFDRGDARGLALALNMLRRSRAQAPQSARLRRFEAVVSIFLALLERRVVEAVAEVRGLLAEIDAPDFEFEAACNLMMVLARLDSSELHLAELPEKVAQLGARFAVSRTTCDLLCATVRARPELMDAVRDEFERINGIAEQAVARTVAGEPAAAASILLSAAERSLNAKLMDLAMQTVRRHGSAIPQADALLARLQHLHDTYRSYGAQVRIARIDDARSLQAAARPDTVVPGGDAAAAGTVAP